jgi:hypothetical protein
MVPLVIGPHYIFHSRGSQGEFSGESILSIRDLGCEISM